MPDQLGHDGHSNTYYIMFAFWASLTVGMKILWGITLAVSLIFIIQTVATFLGADADHSMDGGLDTNLDGIPDDPSFADVHSTGMNLLTFRNFINFLLGFGWSAVLLTEIPWGWRIVIAVAIGCGLVALVMYLFKWLSHMQQSGNINVYKSAVGCTGSTYLTIPGARKGQGKVQITINGAVREYEAITDGDTLPTGTRIRVVEVIDPSTLLVEEINTLIV